MKVLGRDKPIKFYGKHTNAKATLEAWFDETSTANWQKSHDIRARYSSADFLQDNRVIFNIKGNYYRLVVKVRYQGGVVVIEWIGTHADYDKKSF